MTSMETTTIEPRKDDEYIIDYIERLPKTKGLSYSVNNEMREAVGNIR